MRRGRQPRRHIAAVASVGAAERRAAAAARQTHAPAAGAAAAYRIQVPHMRNAPFLCSLVPVGAAAWQRVARCRTVRWHCGVWCAAGGKDGDVCGGGAQQGGGEAAMAVDGWRAGREIMVFLNTGRPVATTATAATATTCTLEKLSGRAQRTAS
jgi:hypothetical protein